MDFFEHQEVARRKSHVLVVYFLLAVAGIIAAVYGLVVLILTLSGESVGKEGALPYWDPMTLLFTAGGTGAVIFLASSFKSMQLAGGGAVVARGLGGRELDINTTDFHERRLLNLVEEMAIASGVPVPSVYVMDAEDAINAFAAGRTTSDAVIGVTRGCMTLLTRDELQGVIAHEFSHILNGDMRLNIRLMGLVFGILFLSLVGEFILRNAFRGGSSSSKKEGAGLALAMLVAGLGLLLIGYIGAFFANLIKASVSRQREYLADASAVQFTRNPDGIAGALKKIGGLATGSKVTHPMAKDASHLFFGSALTSPLFATHPPLSERIRRLLPHWDGNFGKVALRPITETSEAAPPRGAASPGTAAQAFSLAENAAPLRLEAGEAMESFRTVHPEQVELGRDLHQNLPSHWLEACRSRDGAQCLVFALLLAQDDTLRSREVTRLHELTDETSSARAAHLFGELAPVHSAVKIGLIDLAIPTLRHLSRDEYARFRRILHELISSDGQVNLFEFMLLQIVTRHLDTFFDNLRPEPIRFRRIQPLLEDAGVVLSTLAAMSHPEDSLSAEKAFAAAASHLRQSFYTEVPRQDSLNCGLERIKKALGNFAQASPLLKKQFLEACSLSVMADKGVSSREAELIRAVADAIGCPIPPFVRAARQV
ncbi:MAG: M48 family metallopeptidase [Verrucomicrobiae bacterium]|nr:M48 family metallopeptidase [Verrucomicrobiae bacterium]